MIRVIKKRDGSTEDFNPEKVNGWGVWASKSLGGFVDWSTIVLAAVSKMPEVCSSETLQNQLIQECLDQGGWAYQRMAGRLYASLTRKQVYGSDKSLPTVKNIHDKLLDLGLMVKLDYNDQDYSSVEQIIKHDRDFKYAWFQLQHIRTKYSLRDRVKKLDFETAQFTFMRMAMALAEDEPKQDRLHHIKKWYDHLSLNRLNAPTPNYNNLGTKHNGYASCCLYVSEDNENSLGIGDHIARKMTVMSAGIGGMINSRSLGDPVRKGLIEHQGKLPYYRALTGAVRSSLQNGRGGACTTYVSAYDPEIESIIRLKHPMSPEDKKIRGIDYAVAINKHLLRAARKNENIFLFNAYTHPKLNKALFSNVEGEFEAEYEKVLNTESKKKLTWINARKLCVDIMTMGYETGRLYLFMVDEANQNTPFKDSIYSSNLCLEILEPTTAYTHMPDLYTNGPVGKVEYIYTILDDPTRCPLHSTKSWSDVVRTPEGRILSVNNLKVGDRYSNIDNRECEVQMITEVRPEPEVALCSLAAIVPSNIADQEEYEDVAYYALKMIDKCIHKCEFPLAHVGYTSRQRLSAGVGMAGIAHYLARKKLKYTSQEGKVELHRLSELHAYSCIRASLRLGKELGNAPWIHRTKWPDGWLPIDRPSRITEELGLELQQDWETLRKEIVQNGGIRNSVVLAHMPVESSSKASGCPNGVYPIRDLTIAKTDGSNFTYWAATDSDRLSRWYEIAWDIPYLDMIQCYSIIQKFTDQSTSADFWRRVEDDETISDSELLDHLTQMVRYGMKTRYYQNSKVSASRRDPNPEIDVDQIIEKEELCSSGGCDV